MVISTYFCLLERHYSLRSYGTFSRLSNYFAICESDERLSQLVAFMLKHRDSKIIVFFLTCASVNFFWKALKSLEEFQDYPLYSLHGKIPAKKRNGSLYSCLTYLPADTIDFRTRA